MAGSAWKLEDRLTPLTPEESDLVAKNYFVIDDAIRSFRGTVKDYADCYDAIILRYLQTAKKYLNDPYLQKWSFEHIAFIELCAEIRNYLTATDKRRHQQHSYEAPIPGAHSRHGEDDLTFENVLGCGEQDYSYIFGEDELSGRQVAKRALAKKIELALSEKQFDVAVMYGNGVTITEIASAMGIARGTVGSTMNMARHKIARMELPEEKYLYGDSEVENAFGAPIRKALSQKEKNMLHDGLDALNERDQAIFVLYAAGKTHREIAEAVGRTANGVSTRISQIRRKIEAMPLNAAA